MELHQTFDIRNFYYAQTKLTKREFASLYDPIRSMVENSWSSDEPMTPDEEHDKNESAEEIAAQEYNRAYFTE